MKPVVAYTFPLPDEGLALLREVGSPVGPEGWRGALPEAEALLCLLTDRVDRDLLQRAPRLRIVADASVGYDNVDVAACRERGVLVTHTPDVLTEATADLAWALILMVTRRLPEAEAALRAGEFGGWGFWDHLGGEIGGAQLGIFGMGRIGRAVARRANAFGTRVRYTTRTPLSAAEERSLGAKSIPWHELLETSDILSLHAPLTPETRHVVDRAALARIKPGAVLVNTARGALVDEAALVEALRAGRLSGAGLDVYEREPEVHPGLLELPNVALLPHIGSATRATRERMAVLAARNVHEVLAGRDALTPVAG